MKASITFGRVDQRFWTAGVMPRSVVAILDVHVAEFEHPHHANIGMMGMWQWNINI